MGIDVEEQSLTAHGQQEGLFGADVPSDIRRVDALVAQVAQQRPSALAVAAADGQLTYGELHERAGEVARHLLELGVAAEELVGLCLPRSAALVVGALGILRAGAAYVALDPDSPTGRLNHLLADCAASVLVTSPGAGCARGPSALGPTTVEVTADGVVAVRGDARARTGLSEPPSSAQGRRSPLAYVVYTSGSSGSPKGVLVEHAGLLNLVAWHRRAFALTAADRGSQIASPGFDAAVWELWPYLAAGASVHVPPTEVRADPPTLRDWLVSQQITVSFLPTALAEQVSVLDWPDAPALRLVLTGGDRLRHPPRPGLPFELVNNYGVSEATVVSTSGFVRVDAAGAPSIGRAIDGVDLVVADHEQRVVPAGNVGELMIGGVSVARGYLNQPELTRARFASPPWAGPGQRWYRTGDLVRQGPDRDLEFLGRLDDQVQIRGVRIEPEEVSAHLDQHPDVLSSVVVAVGEEAVERRLYAYLVARDESNRPSRQQLQDYLGGYLPQQMIPTGFGWIPEIPRTHNGKVDRGSLPASVPDENALAAGEVEASDELEQAVSAVVAELLGLDRVAPHDNFFLLGGHSLLGAQLIARIGDQFGVTLGLRALFDHPTSAGLATEVESQILAETEALTDEQAAELLGDFGTLEPKAGPGPTR